VKAFIALLALVVAQTVTAQPFPSKTVRFINPFPPGGPLDLLARVLSERLTGNLGKPVIVENRPGASGNVAAEAVARATPDGHTVLLALFSMVTSNPHLYPQLPFDPLKDFAPVTALAAADSVLIVHPSVPARSVAELISYAKANPGKLNYASGGQATPGHLTGEYFRLKTGTHIIHVPYKGNAEAIRSVFAGETQIMFTPTTGALAHIKSGKLKALAVYHTEAVDELPGVPSLGAQGFAGFDQRNLPFWYGMLVPAGTPRDVVMRLHAETVGILQEPSIAARLRAARLFVIGNTPAEFALLMREGHAAWGRVIRETGVKAE
jgi:tripartite-type tricarboxylate transporter receptor subunit TctC